MTFFHSWDPPPPELQYLQDIIVRIDSWKIHKNILRQKNKTKIQLRDTNSELQ